MNTRIGKRTIIKDLSATQSNNSLPNTAVKPVRTAGDSLELRTGLRAGMPPMRTTSNYKPVD